MKRENLEKAEVKLKIINPVSGFIKIVNADNYSMSDYKKTVVFYNQINFIVKLIRI